MRRATVAAAGVVAFLLGLSPSWSLPAAAQQYKAAPPTESGSKSEGGQGGQHVPRRRPATAGEVKPVTDPALSDHCAWLGKRIISLLVRDDAMTADDFTPFYTKFGCPEEHLSKAFGCLVANLMTMETGALADQADECWRDPSIRYVPVNGGSGKSPIEPSRPRGEAPEKTPPAAPSSK